MTMQNKKRNAKEQKAALFTFYAACDALSTLLEGGAHINDKPIFALELYISRNFNAIQSHYQQWRDRDTKRALKHLEGIANQLREKDLLTPSNELQAFKAGLSSVATKLYGMNASQQAKQTSIANDGLALFFETLDNTKTKGGLVEARRNDLLADFA